MTVPVKALKDEPPFTAYRGAETYVFVCYSHHDTAAVYDDLALLRSSGVRIWYDEGISPGTQWSDELARALDGAARGARAVAEFHAGDPAIRAL
jgi:hypothetical protein